MPRAAISSPGAIQIIGLREFRLALKAADAQLPAELAKGMNVIGQDILIPEVRKRIQATTLSGTTYLHNKPKGNLLRSLKTFRTTPRSAGIIEGNKQSERVKSAVPYAGWWEFGGWTKSPIWGQGLRTRVKKGRAMYPALVAKRPEIIAEMEHLLNNLRRYIEAG